MSTTLTDGQVELRADTDDALVIGPGTSYRFTTDWINWWTAPAVRTSDLERGGVNGLLTGRDLLGSHATPIVVQILADDPSDLGDKVDAWKQACAVSSDEDVVIRANLLGRTRRRVGRLRGPGEISLRGKMSVAGAVVNGACQFECTDPVTYGDTVVSAVTTREVAGTGFTVPFSVGFSLGASSGGGLSITNGGNRPAPWTARLDGPLTYPEITHTQSGKRLALSLSANGGVDLASGQWLDIDSQQRSVMLNGTADQRSRLTIDSEWWDLPPGQNDFTFRADTGTGTLTVTAYDAWHS